MHAHVFMCMHHMWDTHVCVPACACRGALCTCVCTLTGLCVHVSTCVEREAGASVSLRLDRPGNSGLRPSHTDSELPASRQETP